MRIILPYGLGTRALNKPPLRLKTATRAYPGSSARPKIRHLIRSLFPRCFESVTIATCLNPAHVLDGGRRGAPPRPQAPCRSKMAITIRDVAQTANVAPSVVSRLLNDDPTLRIRPETEARVRKAVSRLNYHPNHAGRALRSTKATTIGLLLPDVTSPVFADTIQGTVEEAANTGRVVLIGRTDDLDAFASSYRRLIAERRIDGVILQVSPQLNNRAMTNAIDTSVPTVLVNSRLDNIPGSVCIDDRRAAFIATRHLLDLGHRNIGMLAGPRRMFIYRQRELGYKQALAETGIEVSKSWVTHGTYDVVSGEANMWELVKRNRRMLPSAIVVSTVTGAVGALRVAHAEHIDVPRELSIVSVNDFWFAEDTTPPLTTVRTPQFALGVAAMRALAKRIDGGAPEDIIVDEPPAEIVTRGSTAPPPG
jgi:LacI family transcriptional regulator